MASLLLRKSAEEIVEEYLLFIFVKLFEKPV